MRTTVELTEAQRAELLKLAAQRGMKGSLKNDSGDELCC